MVKKWFFRLKKMRFKYLKAWVKDTHFVHLPAIKVQRNAPRNQTAIKTLNLYFTRSIATFSCLFRLLLPYTSACGYAILEEISVFSGESFRRRSHLSFFIARRAQSF